ncbi:hypothetical protein [Ideonella sp.]|jgi:hypothetical protein|uniref:hypothetical protein n=1 Tax=Ideonella sp. TaxID=1929293 RepID=UPI0037C14BEC
MLMAAMLIKMLTEVALLALLALLGRWLLGLLVGVGREHNVFWRLLDVVVSPVLNAVGRLSQGRLGPGGQARAAAALLLLLWVLATITKIYHCLALGPGACR